MSFKILLLAPDADPSWPEKIRRAVPGVVVNTYSDPQDALDDIADADAAYGTVPPELLTRASHGKILFATHPRARARGSCCWGGSTQGLYEMLGVRPMPFSAVRIAARS